MIVVIGGGIAGPAVAIELRRRGQEVTLLEREIGPRHKVCGEFLSFESHDLFDGLLQEAGLSLRGLGAVPVRNVRLHGATRSSALMALAAPAYSVSRYKLDEALLAAAAAAGVNVLRGCTATELVNQEELREVRFASSINSQPDSIAFEKVIVATGKSEFAPLGPRPSSPKRQWMGWKSHIELDAGAIESETCEIYVFPGGYAGLQPTEAPGVYNLCAALLLAGPEKQFSPPRSLDEFVNWIEPRSKALANVLRHARSAAATPRPLMTARVPYGWMRTPSREQPGWLYAIGDQAAVVPSLAGEGMTMALIQAAMAGSEIGKEASQESADTSLSLQTEIKNKFAHEIRMALWCQAIFLKPELMDLAIRLIPGEVFAKLVGWFFLSTRSTKALKSLVPSAVSI